MNLFDEWKRLSGISITSLSDSIFVIVTDAKSARHVHKSWCDREHLVLGKSLFIKIEGEEDLYGASPLHLCL
ncbi:MAG: hypothetical protein AAFY20_19050 [Cyanobacteria bacterium J06639_14]